MAVTSTPVSSALRITVQSGTDTNGDPVLTRISFSGIKAGALDQAVYDVAVLLAGLQTFPLAGVTRTMESALTSA